MSLFNSLMLAKVVKETAKASHMTHIQGEKDNISTNLTSFNLRIPQNPALDITCKFIDLPVCLSHNQEKKYSAYGFS